MRHTLISVTHVDDPAAEPSPAQPPTAPDVSTAVDALIIAQRQLSQVVVTIDDDQYRRKPVGVVPSSIGGHVRHCLDHVEALLAAADCRALSYDARRRDPLWETERRAALATVDRQIAALRSLAGRSSDESWRLTALVAADAPPVVVSTTLGRELSFVISHTIHHSSFVALMVRLLGANVPERFGYAPATTAYLEGRTCAR
jgi:uncharacterized damage-inducible protein DinB